MTELKIIDIINSPNAILHNFGIQVYEEIRPYLQKDQMVMLSFEGLRNLTSGFCNAAIGKVYMEFVNANKLLNFKGLDENTMWQHKVSSAIDLATHPKKIVIQNNAISELLSS